MLWEWPQITIAVVQGVAVALSLLLNGRERSGKHNASLTLLSMIAINVVYYFGGFWTVVRP